MKRDSDKPNGRVAQLAESRIFNPVVAGSSPVAPTQIIDYGFLDVSKPEIGRYWRAI